MLEDIMKRMVLALLLLFSSNIYSQSINVQSIDFDSLGRVVFGLTVWDETSSVVRYSNGNWEEWNLTNMFGLDSYFIITSIDHNGNILALQQEKLYKFNGAIWDSVNLPFISYIRYAHIAEDTQNNIWISIYLYPHIVRIIKITDSIVTDYSSYLPSTFSMLGEITVENDSIWICSNNGLALLYNDTVQVFDTTNTTLPTQSFYSYHRDSEGRIWIGSINKGLIGWDSDSTYVMYNSDNTEITSNFINAIAEDSEGTIWFANDDGFASLTNGIVTVHPELYEDWSIVAIEVDEDDNIWIGTAHFGLYIYNKSGFSLITSAKEYTLTPTEYVLAQNYPNPFNQQRRSVIKFPSLVLSI